MSNFTTSFAIVTGTLATVVNWASVAISGSSHYSPLSLVLIIIGIIGLLAVIGELIVYRVAKKHELHTMITEMSRTEQDSISTGESRRES